MAERGLRIDHSTLNRTTRQSWKNLPSKEERANEEKYGGYFVTRKSVLRFSCVSQKPPCSFHGNGTVCDATMFFRFFSEPKTKLKQSPKSSSIPPSDRQSLAQVHASSSNHTQTISSRHAGLLANPSVEGLEYLFGNSIQNANRARHLRRSQPK